MKISLAVSILVLSSCSLPKITNSDVLGAWKLDEMRCESEDYTPAGLSLREYYKSKTAQRIMIVKKDSLLTTITENSEKNKDCKVVMDSKIILTRSTMQSLSTKVSKRSKTDDNCKGNSVKGKSKGKSYAVNNDTLVLTGTSKSERINPKDPSQLCKKSNFLSIYKRM